MNEIELNIKDAFLKYLKYVDKLVKENDELKSENERMWKQGSENYVAIEQAKTIYELQEENKQLKAKNEKFKQCLEEIKDYCIETIKANKDLNENGDCILAEIIRLLKECEVINEKL